MAEPKTAFWQRPFVGVVAAIGAALWEAFQSGDIGRYATIPTLVFVLAVAQVMYALFHERNELRQSLDDRELKIGIAKELGKLLKEADEKGLQSLDSVHSQDMIDQFDRRVEAYLEGEPKLGSDYVALYRSGAGIQITKPAEMSGEHLRQWCHMHTKKARLVEFIEAMRQG